MSSLDLGDRLGEVSFVDRRLLWVCPVVRGVGKRVFEPGIAPTAFIVTGSVTYPGGSVNLVMSPNGRPSFGNMTTEQG